MQRNKRRHIGARAIFEAGHMINPLTLAELDRIVQIWADACLQLRDRDLEAMQRLAVEQDQLKLGLQAAE